MASLIGEVPFGWRESSLGELCEMKSGPSGALRGRAKAGEAVGVPVVMTKDFRFNAVNGDQLMRVSDRIAAELFAYRLQAGDIICARTGELGRQALIGEAEDGWLYGTACIRLRPDPEQLQPRYLLYYLGHPNIVKWVKRNATGSAIPSISGKVLATLPVVLPPLRVQAEISEVLVLLDIKAALHDEIARTTVTLRDSLLPNLYAGRSVKV